VWDVGPSRYVLMTGRHPTRAAATEWFHLQGSPHRVERFRGAESVEAMPLDEVTIAEALRPLGYQTWHVGKWHLGEAPTHWPEAQGFDVNIAGTGRGAPSSEGSSRGHFSPYGNPRLSDGPPGEYLDDRLADEAVRLIERRPRDQPFFLHYSVHVPLQAPAASVTK
jgi:arylsulfatase A-like enzyme